MAELSVPESEQDFYKNFEQIKPLMNKTEAYYESSRCLFCFNAPCTEACPTKIDIPLFTRQINNGNTTGAARTIYTPNYLGAICGKVCPTEVICEGACVFNNQNVKPIEIGRLQNYAAQTAVIHKQDLFEIPAAGISCACELGLAGVEVDIFEAERYPSGLALFGSPPTR